jgi:predicted nuclease of restriction endonuclease-like (RecB) superfamily
MSKDPSHLSKMVNENLDYIPSSEEIMKDVFTFEFLGLQEKYLVNESDLEKAILDNIESFILELGHGFCFEARQQKILIDEDYYFIDLVFYHRILKCHVLIDLKVENFTHYNAGQLNVYLNYYKDKIVRADDNPPIGILFVTDKSKALVEYATAGMDQQLFARKYLMELPDKEVMKKIIEKEIGII